MAHFSGFFIVLLPAIILMGLGFLNVSMMSHDGDF